MTELSKDQPKIALPKVPAFLQERGITVSLSGVTRWTKEGVRGIKLRTYRVGGRIHTDERAICEFISALSQSA